jgi:hypothetical protein
MADQPIQPQNEQPIPEGFVRDDLGRIIPFHAWAREACVQLATEGIEDPQEREWVEQQTREMIEEDTMRDALG